MSKVILTVGCSASGKSTWAKEFVKDNPDYVIVERDQLRLMMGFPPVGSNDQEKIITKMQRGLIESSLLDGMNVIISDTNINKGIRNGLVDYIHKLGHDVEFHIFDTDLDTCIARDRLRANSVGEIVIRKQFNKFRGLKDKGFADLDPRPVPRYADYVHADDRTDVIVVDIDGTVAEGKTVRNMHDYTKVLLDLPRQDVIDVVRSLSKDYYIVFVSGRKASCREDTVQWLKEYVQLEKSTFELFMRDADDERPDYIIKNEIYDRELIPFYNIKMVLDDRNQVVNHLRARGITVAQVAPGRF